MKSDELVVVRTFLNAFEADAAVAALSGSGIEAIKRCDDCGGLRPQLWLGGVDVVVRSEDLERATEVLQTSSPTESDGSTGRQGE